MTITFEIVSLVFVVGGIALCATRFFSVTGTLSELGHHDHSWFDHAQDAEVSERPSEDEPDAPLPLRPMRGRPSWF